MRLILCTILSVVCGLAAESSTNRTPVLVELFTSEGCSSCPPADRLLETLDRRQRIAGADVIVLSEHVDYWNHLGWKDPFSSAVYSERQRQYARSLSGEVYTPELVVDGAVGMVGSDEAEVQRAIGGAARKPKHLLNVTATREGKHAIVQVRADGAVDGVLYLALAHDSAKSQVLKGENAGHGLSHVAVVYSLVKAAMGETRVDVPEGKTRVVAFVAAANGHVTALGQALL